MKDMKLSRETKYAFGARFAANLKRLMEEKGMGLTDFGRRLRPGNKSPASTAYALVHAKVMPKDDVVAACAKVLGVAVEKLHEGELEQYKASKYVRGAQSVRDARKEVGAFAGTAARKERTDTVEEHGPARTKAKVDVVDAEDVVDELYAFVLDAVRARMVELAEPERRAYVLKLAQVCKEFGA